MELEWTAYSKDKQDLVFVYAESQKEAIVKAMERGIKPSQSSDVRPRMGDTELMSTEEFKEFMSST